MRLITFCLVLLVGPTSAAHITDRLVVGLYPAAKADGTPLQLLPSGTPLEVLGSESGFSEVRLANGKNGWVESIYVTEEQPVQARLLETQARLRQMGLELARLREGESAAEPVAALQQRITDLETQLAEQPTPNETRQRLDEVNAQVRAALDKLARTQGLIIQERHQPERSWAERYGMLLIGAVAAMLGFVAGVFFIDFRIRKRYGGFRLR